MHREGMRRIASQSRLQLKLIYGSEKASFLVADDKFFYVRVALPYTLKGRQIHHCVFCKTIIYNAQ
jgi:hypothetical protein